MVKTMETMKKRDNTPTPPSLISNTVTGVMGGAGNPVL